MSTEKILILGLGNYLMGDEGIGIHTIQQYENKNPEFVDVIDGGTGGFHLLSLFSKYEVIIIIDATLSNDPPGTIKIIEPKYSADFPKSLSSHDIGLKDLIESASFIGEVPRMFIIAITVKDFREVRMELTPQIEQLIPEIHKQINIQVTKLLS
jgi:hydrogenase maturation protease